VPARDALARALRSTDRAASDAVKRLRKPTVAAWGLNAVARAHPADVDALLAAGDALRAAQEAALRGDASGLRAATEDRRRAVGTLAGRVATLLGSAPAGVSATLEAATVDPEVGALLKAGRLDRERSAAAAGFGFGDVGDWTPPPPRPASPAAPAARVVPAAPEPEPEPEPDGHDAALESAVAEAQERAAELHDAEEAVAALKARLADATAVLRTARTRGNKAELHAEALRQRAWEQGERRRRERRPSGESDRHAP
jgi:hypothetical protein